MENNEKCCLAKILKVIDILQKECSPECYPEGCDKPFLGNTEGFNYNNRPITLYSKNGNLFTASYYVNNVLTTSSVFRVEDVNKCCCKLRILSTTVEQGVTTYNSTNEFITVDLNCFCILSCLDDIYLENL